MLYIHYIKKYKNKKKYQKTIIAILHKSFKKHDFRGGGYITP